FVDLLKDFTDQAKTFLKEEVRLAKKEISENISHLGRDAMVLGIGGGGGFFRLLVLLGGVGVFFWFFFLKLGVDPRLANFIGLVVVGLLVMAAGGFFIIKAIKAFPKETVTPKKTIHTIQVLKGSEAEALEKPEAEKPKDQRTTDQIEASVLRTEEEMGQTLIELGHRVTLAHARKKADEEVRSHPYRWGLVAMGTGFLGSLLIGRKFRRSSSCD